MEENKDDDNEKEVNDTDDVKNGDFQKTIMLNRHRLRQSGESQSDSLPLVQMLCNDNMEENKDGDNEKEVNDTDDVWRLCFIQ